LREALDGFSRAQLPWEASVCRLDLAPRLQRDQPRGRRRPGPRAALLAFEALAAARYVDAATALLRQLGEKVAAPRPSGQTARETEVMRLLGEGLSNPEIAERLYLSRKTVEHHVGNILGKLGLRNRAEAAAYAVRRTVAEGERERTSK
jgi:DNA-binding CsgD family transcriptional regulator